MENIILMHAKLHRLRVTDAQLNYVGSITIDTTLLSKVGILPLEQVDIVNLNNGKRWSTYVLPGEAGQVCPNGGGALLCNRGDILVIWANTTRDRQDVMQSGHKAKIIVTDENNDCLEYFEQTLIANDGSLTFSCDHKHRGSEDIYPTSASYREDIDLS
ncbi:aspartate 1-decarboxylase [Thalassomonas viridans]|uniref:Aspartate 1-decarboxylase n=1 Tax=Thalassomonas viridans TaxID=137584 RepID=A0AAE9Z3B5_9GAMM|nr:aspartate 1-decarboxylase [Thalassomonas viridans]WDE05976.1 aspartate 1-decarboxylase [Thalassomonas viridans]